MIVKQFFKKRPANHYLFVCMYMRICMYAWACQLPVQTYPALCAGRKLQIRNEPYHPMCMTTIPSGMVVIHMYVGMDGWKDGLMLLVPEPDARARVCESNRCVSSALLRSQGVRAK